jgi:succinate dehydrogenase/fumarate reductase flavoprotein subunit
MVSTVDRFVNHVLDCEVLIIGGGCAGLFSAIKAREAGRKVILVDKAYVGRSGCSPFAAGAINVCLPEDDKDIWLKEIVNRGEYLNDQEWVKLQLEEGYKLVDELHGWGKQYGKVVMDTDDHGRYIRRKARGNIRTLTGIINALPMMDTLRRKSLETGIELVERVMVTHLFLHEGRVVGALGLHTRTGELYLFTARAVILAAGGCGFKSFFIGHQNLTGEAHFMAFRAGAWLRNLDQAMSNTTARALDIHGLSHMVGCGGRFLNSQNEEFMLRYDPEVGSRARLTKLVTGMAKEIQAGRGPIYMDLTRVVPKDQVMLRRILPEGFRAFERMGMDPFKNLIEWIPSFEGSLAHGGGVHINIKCESNIPGLYAVGDASCTPEHGTWSITGLNLTFCFLSGARAGYFSAEYTPNISPAERAKIADQVAVAVEEVLAPLKRSEGIHSDEFTYRLLETLIPYKVAYLRTESTLKEALTRVQKIRQEDLERVHARDPHELVKANEARSMVWIGEMILESVLFRKESRGFVYREDYPNTDNIDWLKWIMLCQEKDRVRVWAQDFPTPYVQPPLKIYSPFGGSV